MKRYKVQKADNGQYKIVDTSLNLVVAWVEKKSPADRACKHINENYEKTLTKSS